MIWLYLMIHDCAAIAGGVYLIHDHHPGWATLCFILAATTTIKSRQG